MRVKIGDLDLRSNQGASVAMRRIETEAKSFCGIDYSRTGLVQRTAARSCYKRMTYMAVNKLDAPLVTAQYTGAGGTPPIQFARR